MARPSAEVLLSDTHDTGLDEILLAQGLWVVCYRTMPIAIRQQRWNRLGCKFKYPRSIFTNPAHAYKLAEQLNKQFNTEEFSVKEY